MSRISDRYEHVRASLPTDVADDRNLTPKQAAMWLSESAKTLRKWRNAKPRKGPPFVQINRRIVRYPLDQLRAWRNARTERGQS